MNNNIKLLGFGFLGGLIPMALFFAFQGTTFTNNQEGIVLGGPPVHRTNFEGLSEMSTDFTVASENSINSVVHITTKVVQTSFHRDIYQEFFYGPGAGGKEYKQYGSDPSTDIAVLKIEAKDLVAIPIGNSDDLKIGEWVLAVGNPFNLTSTVTAGIVSAKARNINLLADRNRKDIVPIESFIQTDAAVNPGNSGGALVNTRGELVGINTAIASQTGSYSGYSFAVPVNLVQKVTGDLIDYGIVQRGYLGIQISDISQEIKTKYELPDTKGVFIQGVTEGGSAERSGLKEGDVILKIGTKEINSTASLQEEIGKRRPGDKVMVTYRSKNGDEEMKELVLRNSEGETSLVSKAEVNKNLALGAIFEELSSKDKKELNTTYGVKIKSISAGKLQSEGLKPGMVITKINNEPVKTVEQLTTKLNAGNTGVLLEVLTESGQKAYVGFGL